MENAEPLLRSALPPYLTGIEGPPPKRNVVSSSLAGGARTTAVSRFSLVYSGFFVIILAIESTGTQVTHIVVVVPKHLLHGIAVTAGGYMDYLNGQQVFFFLDGLCRVP